MIAFRKNVLKITQEEMVKELGITNAMLSHIELGKRDGSIEFWHRYYEQYGKQLEENDLNIWNLYLGGKEKNDTSN